MGQRCLKVKLSILLILACLSSVIFVMQAKAPHIEKTIVNPSDQFLSDIAIKKIAQNITVEIFATQNLGSGIIFSQQEQFYTVITNHHVLRSDSPPYKIQTPDGKIYVAEVININNVGNDLAFLRFRSPIVSYKVAKLGSSASLQIGDEVFAGGFPYQYQNPNSLHKFAFKTGIITLPLDKPLKGGYQLGYTNDIEKGMSGGPLLNRQGKVLGINGLHGNPLWEAPDYFFDGSEPCPPLQKLITRYSFSIPMETIINLISESSMSEHLNYNLKQEALFSTTKTQLPYQEEVTKLQYEANLAKKCQPI